MKSVGIGKKDIAAKAKKKAVQVDSRLTGTTDKPKDNGTPGATDGGENQGGGAR